MTPAAESFLTQRPPVFGPGELMCCSPPEWEWIILFSLSLSEALCWQVTTPLTANFTVRSPQGCTLNWIRKSTEWDAAVCFIKTSTSSFAFTVLKHRRTRAHVQIPTCCRWGTRAQWALMKEVDLIRERIFCLFSQFFIQSIIFNLILSVKTDVVWKLGWFYGLYYQIYGCLDPILICDIGPISGGKKIQALQYIGL